MLCHGCAGVSRGVCRRDGSFDIFLLLMGVRGGNDLVPDIWVTYFSLHWLKKKRRFDPFQSVFFRLETRGQGSCFKLSKPVLAMSRYSRYLADIDTISAFHCSQYVVLFFLISLQISITSMPNWSLTICRRLSSLIHLWENHITSSMSKQHPCPRDYRLQWKNPIATCNHRLYALRPMILRPCLS